MNFKIKRSILVFCAMLWLQACSWHPDDTAISLNQVRNLTAAESFEIIEGDKEGEITILDIRTPEEYAAGRIPGAFNFDFFSPVFRKNLKELDNERRYLIYCQTGGRSSQAIREMTEEGFTNIYHMNRGISDWLRKNLPLEK